MLSSKQFIRRDLRRTEDDDFKLNVEDRLGDYKEAAPVYRLPPACYIAGREELIGWNIQYKYE